MAQYQIQPMAWAPFAEGQNGNFQNPELAAVGQKYGKTPAQVILRWLRQSKIVSIPKSVHEERIRQNYDVDDFNFDGGGHEHNRGYGYGQKPHSGCAKSE